MIESINRPSGFARLATEGDVMKTVYINMKTPQGVETVDEFTRGSDDAPAGVREFWQYVRSMIAEYRLAGMAVYRSGRPCKDWQG